MDATLEIAKAKVRQGLIDGDDNGVVGVGIDPTENAGQGSLELFYSEAEKIKAEDFAASLKQEFGIKIKSHRGELPASPIGFLALAGGKIRGLFRGLIGEPTPATPPTLSLKMRICQSGQEHRRGSLGCFVKLTDGSVHALTARHLFSDPSAKVFSCDLSGANDVIGDSLKRSSAGSGINLSECARFAPVSGAVLRSSEVLGGFISKESDMPLVEGKKVRCLASGAFGVVLDTKAVIMYSLPESPNDLILFDSQVLVRDIVQAPARRIGAVFGDVGDSGSLVVLGEVAGSFKVNDAVGLYTWTNNKHYHIVTPFYDCASQLGIASIYNPP